MNKVVVGKVFVVLPLERTVNLDYIVLLNNRVHIPLSELERLDGILYRCDVNHRVRVDSELKLRFWTTNRYPLLRIG